MEALRVEDLRRRTCDFVARAEAGESFVVMRHSRPLAILRAVGANDRGDDVAVSRFRAGLGQLTRRARRRHLQIMYRGRRVAALVPVPARVRRRYGAGPNLLRCQR